jgi:hypothetical protein
MEGCNRKKDCIYALQDECNTDRKHCGYIIITGEPRGCPVGECDKFKSKKDYRREKKPSKKRTTI